MSRKLTEQEQARVLSLAKLLGRKLPTNQRSNAGGIASGLVRVRKDRLAVGDVTSVLERYGAGQEVLDSLVELGVLEERPVPMDGNEPLMTYQLVTPIDLRLARQAARADAAETNTGERNGARDGRATAADSDDHAAAAEPTASGASDGEKDDAPADDDAAQAPSRPRRRRGAKHFAAQHDAEASDDAAEDAPATDEAQPADEPDEAVLEAARPRPGRAARMARAERRARDSHRATERAERAARKGAEAAAAPEPVAEPKPEPAPKPQPTPEPAADAAPASEPALDVADAAPAADSSPADAHDEPATTPALGEGQGRNARRRRARRARRAARQAHQGQAAADAEATDADAAGTEPKADTKPAADAKPAAEAKPAAADDHAPQAPVEEPAQAHAPHAIARTNVPSAPSRADRRPLSRMGYVRKQSPELNDVRRQIIGLDPRLWINGWLLSTPDAFLAYERPIRQIDAALDGSPFLGDGTLSVRELSYRVFGDEKFLAPDADGRKLLHLMGLTDIVRCRPQTRLGLLHHIPRYHKHMKLVVSENLDPWANMHDLMFQEDRKRFLDQRVHGVIFGTGYLVNDPHKLPDLLESLRAEDVTVYYWGDIDRAGLSIMAKLASSAEGRFVVEPFVPAYRLMLRRAMLRYPDPLDNEPCGQEGVPLEGVELFEGRLDEDEMAYLRAVVENSRLIPQEIVTRADL